MCRIHINAFATTMIDMTKIRLNGELLARFIRDECEGKVERFLDIWASRQDLRPDGAPDVPNRSTVYRWIRGTVPLGKNKDEFPRLCGVLDVDPFCMLVPEGGDPANAAQFLLRSFQLNRWDPPALSFIADFFGRQAVWPPKQLAREHFGHSWFVEEFEHDPQRRANYYPLIEIVGDLEVTASRPQLFHFAYRERDLFGGRWLEYGFVTRQGQCVQLLHINGHAESYLTDTPDEPSRVETWFGPGPAIFRIASLHPFSVKVNDPDEDEHQRVRFPG